MEECQRVNTSAIITKQTVRFRRRVDTKTSYSVKKSPKLFRNNHLTGGLNLCLVIDIKEYKFILKQRRTYSTFYCSRERSNHMKNRSLVSRQIGGPENVRAAECTQRFPAKIGHALFHSLFQGEDIVGRSLYETLPTKIKSP